MPRKAFERELQELEDRMLAMASMVQEALTEAVEVLDARDEEGARRLIAQDRTINSLRYGIEEDCLIAIATQQPMAGDLRMVAAILYMTMELERIGDYAKGIARINLMIGETPLLMPLTLIRRMAIQTQSMLKRALQAFTQRDADMARAIPDEDDVVDALYNQVYEDLMSLMLADARNGEQVNYLLWTAHNLERAADRVTNLCERVIYTVTGNFVELGPEDSGLESIH